MSSDGGEPIDLLRSLAQLSSDAIIVADSEMRILAFNEAALGIFGLSADELRGRSVLDMMPPPARQGMQERLGARLGGSNPLLGRTFNSRYTRPDGTSIDIEHVVNTWESGGKRYFGAILRDITEWVRAKEALQESEEVFRNLAEQSPNMIFINVNGRVVYANRRCEELTGFTREEFLSPSFDFIRLTAPEYRPLVAEKFALHTKGQDVPPYEYAIVARDGRRLDTILSTKLIHYRGERAILGTVTDITERKRAEEALRASEEKYRLVSENIPVAVYSALPDELSTNLFLSGRIKDLTGYGADELMKDPALWSNMIYPDDRHAVWERLQEHRRLKAPFEATYRIITKGNEVKWIRDRATPRLDERGEILRIDGFMEDVSGQKRVEEAIRDSEERYRNLFENSPEGVVLLDLDGKILDINRAALALQDKPRKNVVGKSFTELAWIYEEDVPRYMDRFRRRVEGESGPPVEIRVRTPGGDRWEEVFPALLEKDGDVFAIQVILRDVTERRLAQREMLSRLMSYELEEGNLYLVKEAAPVLSLEGFQDLLQAGYRGAVLSRTPAQKFRREPSQQFEFRWISEKESAHTLPPDVASLERWLDGLPRNTAVLVDRLDYLILRNGFDQTLRFVHRVRDLAYLMGHVIILSLDPASVGVKELRSLDREALEIAPRARPTLPDDLYDVLRHVYQQGALGRRPTLTELRQELQLSKPTTTKRVMNLVRGGYLALSTHGRTKQVELTEKGRRVFLK